jgi:nucleotide-binding universal stress UspA family protein
MIRGILIGLDGSKSCETAQVLGLRWAQEHDATFCGLGIVDQPTIAAVEPAGTVGGVVGRDPVYYPGYDACLNDARQRVRELLKAFSDRCTAAGVPYAVHESEGSPAEQIRLAAQRYDLILLGRETHFHFATQDTPDDTLRRVLKNGPRPVISVPADARTGGEIVVAFDGSVEAARAVYAFAASGLGESRPVRVLSADNYPEDAERCAERATAFLHLHGINATLEGIKASDHPSKAILERIEALDAGLVVMGAYGQSPLRELFFGSVTRTMLKESKVPVFSFH